MNTSTYSRWSSTVSTTRKSQAKMVLLGGEQYVAQYQAGGCRRRRHQPARGGQKHRTAAGRGPDRADDVLEGDGLRADRVDREVVRARVQLGAGAREVIDVDRPDPVAARR